MELLEAEGAFVEIYIHNRSVGSSLLVERERERRSAAARSWGERLVT